jgi:hypothetical protein
MIEHLSKGRSGRNCGATSRFLKGDLVIRPISHRLEARIEARVFIAVRPSSHHWRGACMRWRQG